MKVSVKMRKGSSFEIHVEPTAKVADVKKVIENTQGQNVYPAEQQILTHQGIVLEDNTTLEENKVLENNFLVLTLEQAPPTQTVSAASASQTPVPPAPIVLVSAAAPTATASTVPDVAVSTKADSYGQAARSLVATIQSIIEVGGGTWDRDNVLHALRAAFNNPEQAIDYLYSGIPQQLEVPAPPPSSQPANLAPASQPAEAALSSSSSSPQPATTPGSALLASPQPAMAKSLPPELDEPLPVFDQKLVAELIAERNFLNLREYIQTFSWTFPHEDGYLPHHGLMLMVYEMELNVLVGEGKLQEADDLYARVQREMATETGNNWFTAVDLQEKVAQLGMLVNTRTFCPNFIDARTCSLFDYIHLHFPLSIRPARDTSKFKMLQFAMEVKVDDTDRYRCLTCAWVCPAKKTVNEVARFLKYHLLEGGGAKKCEPCPSLSLFLLNKLNQVLEIQEELPDFNGLCERYCKGNTSRSKRISEAASLSCNFSRGVSQSANISETYSISVNENSNTNTLPTATKEAKRKSTAKGKSTLPAAAAPAKRPRTETVHDTKPRVTVLKLCAQAMDMLDIVKELKLPFPFSEVAMELYKFLCAVVSKYDQLFEVDFVSELCDSLNKISRKFAKGFDDLYQMRSSPSWIYISRR